MNTPPLSDEALLRTIISRLAMQGAEITPALIDLVRWSCGMQP